MTTTTNRPVYVIDSPRRLAPGTVLRVFLDQVVEGHGRRWPGPHGVGRAEVMDDGRRLAMWLTETSAAGRTARGLVELDALDITVEGDAPPAVWLRA